MEIDPQGETSGSLHHIVTSLVVPRPIAWISTTSDDGVDNLAPFSSFNYVEYDPPIVMFSAGDVSEERIKDTPRNVIDTEEFVVNIVSRDLAQAMDLTSNSINRDESEFDRFDIVQTDSTTVTPPRVVDTIASLECVLLRVVKVATHTVIFGEVQHFHVVDSVVTDGTVDPEKVETLGRLGGRFYTAIDRVELDESTRSGD